jgi:hypothetical protein
MIEIIPVKCYINNIVHLQSCIRNINNATCTIWAMPPPVLRPD